MDFGDIARQEQTTQYYFLENYNFDLSATSKCLSICLERKRCQFILHMQDLFGFGRTLQTGPSTKAIFSTPTVVPSVIPCKGRRTWGIRRALPPTFVAHLAKVPLSNPEVPFPGNPYLLCHQYRAAMSARST